MSNVWTRLTDVTAHLAHDTNVIVTVQEVVLVLAPARPTARAMRGLVGLERGIAEHNDQALRVFVVGGDGLVLLSDELRQLGRRHRLGSCRRGSCVSLRHVGWAKAGVEAQVRRTRVGTYLRASCLARESLGTTPSLERLQA